MNMVVLAALIGWVVGIWTAILIRWLSIDRGSP